MAIATPVLASGVKNYTIGGDGAPGLISILDEDNNIILQLGQLDPERYGVAVYDENGNRTILIGKDPGGF